MAGEAIPPPSWSGPPVEDWLLKQAVDVVAAKNLSRSVDLFEQGFDRSTFFLSLYLRCCLNPKSSFSLSATFFRYRVVGVMRASKDICAQKATEQISQDMVYKHPTIQKLAVYINELIAPASDSNVADPKTAIEEMVKKYSANLDGRLPVATSSIRPSAANVVLLTGSTGHLGSPLLASLLENPHVRRVYAFNRGSLSGTQSILERHIVKFTDQRLDVTLLQSEKAIFISGDTGLPNLGLDSALYDEVRLVIYSSFTFTF
jgi:Male sterility protein